MGATLADGGVNPLTGERVVDAAACRYTLAVMATAGLYETSGDWLYDVGLPGKSGIGGGIVTVSPGKGGLGTFAPPLDAAGNSVKGSSSPRSCRAGSGSTSSPRSRTRERRRARRARAALALAACSAPAALADLADETALAEQLRAGRPARRAARGVRARASRTSRSTSTRSSTSRPSRCAGPWGAADLVKIGPAADDLSRGLYEYHLDFPGNALDPGCDYEHWARPHHRGEGADRLRARRDRPGHPGKLALQYWLFYAFNDWNNLHEGDWEMIQLVFDADDAARGARRGAGRGRLQPARGRRAGRLGRRQARARRRHASRSCTRPPARTRTSSTRRSTSAARPRRASAATTRRGPTLDVSPVVQTIPSDPAAGARRVPVDRVRGPLGRAAAGVLQRPDRAEPEDAVDGADRLVGGLARPQLRRPRAAALLGTGATDFFCGAVGGGSVPSAGSSTTRSPLLVVLAVLDRARALRHLARDLAPDRAAPRSRAGAPGARSSRPSARMYVSQLRAVPRDRRPLRPDRRSSSRCSRRSSSRVERRSGSTPAARAAASSCFVVVAIGDGADAPRLGLVQAATARALVEIDEGRADRPGARLPAGARQHPAAARRARARRASSSRCSRARCS